MKENRKRLCIGIMSGKKSEPVFDFGTSDDDDNFFGSATKPKKTACGLSDAKDPLRAFRSLSDCMRSCNDLINTVQKGSIKLGNQLFSMDPKALRDYFRAMRTAKGVFSPPIALVFDKMFQNWNAMFDCVVQHFEDGSRPPLFGDKMDGLIHRILGA